MTKEIPFSMPYIGEEEIDEVVSVLRGKWITTGAEVKKFEQAMRDYLDVKTAIAVSSGTAALEISLAALDVGPGDEVLTTAYTFASTALAVIHRGGVPVLIDVDQDTFNISPGLIEQTIAENYSKRPEGLTSKTTGNKLKGMIVVHFAGQPAEMEAINAMAHEHGLFVVEDAAHAIGAEHRNIKIGKSNNLVCFSFYSNKNMTTGEGGMVVTDNGALEEKLRLYTLHGISKSAVQRYKTGMPFYDIVCPGYKANLTDIQAALGVIQMKKLDDITRLRNTVAEWYDHELSGIDKIICPNVKLYNYSARHLYPILLSPDLKEKRDWVISTLRESKIYPSVHFIPVHFHSYFKEYFKDNYPSLPVTEDLFYREISLPIFPELTQDDVKYVGGALREALV